MLNVFYNHYKKQREEGGLQPAPPPGQAGSLAGKLETQQYQQRPMAQVRRTMAQVIPIATVGETTDGDGEATDDGTGETDDGVPDGWHKTC